MLTKELGTVIVRPNGEGLYTKETRQVALKVIANFDPDSVELDENGKIIYAYTVFNAYYQAGWDCEEHGHLYTDKAVVRQLNAWLNSQGYEGRVGWSERGMQDYEYANFDMDYGLIHQFFPEVFEDKR